MVGFGEGIYSNYNHIDVIKNIYENFVTSVRDIVSVTNHFSITIGLCQ